MILQLQGYSDYTILGSITVILYALKKRESIHIEIYASFYLYS